MLYIGHVFVSYDRHLRLGLQHALRLLDLCARVCVNDPLYGRAASVPMLVLLNRFYNERSVQLYFERFVQARASRIAGLHV